VSLLAQSQVVLLPPAEARASDTLPLPFLRLPSPAGEAAWSIALLTTSLPAPSHHQPAALRAAATSVCWHAAVIRQGRVLQPLPCASLPSGSLSCPAAPAARDSAGRGTQKTLGLVGCNSLLRRKAIARLCILSAVDFLVVVHMPPQHPDSRQLSEHGSYRAAERMHMPSPQLRTCAPVLSRNVCAGKHTIQRQEEGSKTHLRGGGVQNSLLLGQRRCRFRLAHSSSISRV